MNIAGSADQVTVYNWFLNSKNDLTAIQAGDGTRFIVGAPNQLTTNNYTAGTSQVEYLAPSTGVSVEYQNFSGGDGTGSLTSQTFKDTDGTSETDVFSGLPAGTAKQLTIYNSSGVITKQTTDYTAGNSLMYLLNPWSGASSDLMSFTGLDGAGTLTGQTFNNTNGTSETDLFPVTPVTYTKEFDVYNAINGAGGSGTITSRLDDSATTSTLYLVNPWSGALNDTLYYSGLDRNGKLTEQTFNNSDGTSETDFFYDAPANIRKTLTVYDSANGVLGTGHETKIITDYNAGNSQMWLKNPWSGASSDLMFFTGWDGSGTLTAQTFDFTGGGSETDTFTGLSAGVSKKSQIFSGTDGTGSVSSTSYTGTSGNNTLTADNASNETLIGSGGYDTYQFGRGNGADTIQNGLSTNSGATGELDFGSGIATNQIWLKQTGNDLQLDIMGTHDQMTLSGWFSNSTSKLQEIKTSDGSMLDSQLNQLVQAMATYGAAHTGFDPTAVTQAPSDSALQSALAASWHH